MGKRVRKSPSKGMENKADRWFSPASMVLFIGKPYIDCLIIAILGILIYSNTFNSPFILDDFSNIVENPVIRNVGFTLSHSYMGRVVGNLTIALNYKLHGVHVTGYHLFNTFIHVVSALLVYCLTFLTLRTPVAANFFKEDILKTSSFYYSIPLCAALLFVSHPIQTQAVTYIVQRYTSLATLFYLLSMVMYIKARGTHTSIMARCLFCGISILSALLAMMTKEIAFTLPFMIILYEGMFFKGDSKKRLVFILPFLLTLPLIPWAIMRFLGVSDIFTRLDQITRIAGTDTSRWDYLNTQFRVLVTYIRLLILPVNQNLDYDYTIDHHFFDPAVMLSLLFLMMIFGMGIYLVYRSSKTTLIKGFWFKLISFGIFWFFITLSVESSVIPIADVIFEHRLYLPSVGFLMAVVGAIILIKENLPVQAVLGEKAFMIVMMILVLTLSVTAYARNMVWRNEGTLWEDVRDKSPFKARPYNHLGVYYQEQGRIDEAIKAYEKGISLSQPYATMHINHYNLGVLYQSQGRLEDAVKEYQAAIKLKPDYPNVYNNLGMVYQIQGRSDEAVKALKTSIKLEPDFAESHNNLAGVFLTQGRLDEAIKEIQRALKLNPNYAKAYNNLGIAYAAKGLFDDAVRAYKMAIGYKPDYADARRNLGLLYKSRGRSDEAIKEFQTAEKIEPDNKDSRGNLESIKIDKIK